MSKHWALGGGLRGIGEGMGRSSYSGGDEVSGQVPVVPFLLSALMEMGRHGRGKFGVDGMAWHVEVGLVAIAGCYLSSFFAHIQHLGLGFVGVKRMGLGCMDMDMGWLDGEGAVGVWMGWEGKREWEKGRGRRSVFWAQFAHSLAQPIYLLIIVDSWTIYIWNYIHTASVTWISRCIPIFVKSEERA